MKIAFHCDRLLRLCFTLTLLVPASQTAIADELEMWVQRWGILDGQRLCDFDATSNQLLNAYRDGAVLWDMKSGLALRRYLPLADESPRVQDGGILDKHILLGGTYFVSLLDKQSGELVRSFDLERDQLNSLVTNRQQTLFAALTTSRKLSIWEIETGRRLHVIDVQQTSGEMEFSPDSRLLLCGSEEHLTATGIRDDQLDQIGLLPHLQAVIVPENVRFDDLALLRKRHPTLEIIRKSESR